MKRTGRQIKAAMGLLDLNNEDIVKATGITAVTVRNVLNDSAKSTTADKVADYLESQGAEFLEHEGVRLKPASAAVEYRGHSGFVEFMKDVAFTAETLGKKADICVSGVDESLFEKWQGDYAETYLGRMAAAHNKNGFVSRIIVCEGDNYYTASKYAEYRQAQKENFVPASSYIYGDKFASIVFYENDVTVFIIDNKELANGQRVAFNAFWEKLDT